MGFGIESISVYKGERMTCSSCMHAASKNKHRSTIPSIHTCMNKASTCYLIDNAWSDTCDYWELMPDKFVDVIDICDTFDDSEYFRLIGMMIDKLDEEM